MMKAPKSVISLKSYFIKYTFHIMMIFFKSTSIDPYWNLALEQAVFEHAQPNQSYCMLWQNQPSVIIGQYQNAMEEINLPYIRAHHIPVVRRLSGGGAVYHDLGGLNYTLIVPDQEEMLDMERFCLPVTRACAKFGILAKINGRNDITVEGKKISGTAAYQGNGKTLHHGSILIATDFAKMEQALTVSSDKFVSKAVHSIRSRVGNLQDFCKQPLSVESFTEVLLNQLDSTPVLSTFSEKTLASAKYLFTNRYSHWEWNFGSSPLYTVTKRHRFPGCGLIIAEMDIEGGILAGLHFSGDFFSNRKPSELEDLLIGHSLQRKELSKILHPLNINLYFRNLDYNSFLEWLCL